jgi:hypothetical protein
LSALAAFLALLFPSPFEGCLFGGSGGSGDNDSGSGSSDHDIVLRKRWSMERGWILSELSARDFGKTSAFVEEVTVDCHNIVRPRLCIDLNERGLLSYHES